MEVKDRKDIDVKDTWNLESIYHINISISANLKIKS